MMVTNCSICDAEYGLQSGISFHRLPKVDSRRERWITAINKRIKNFIPTANVFICSQHFSENCFLISPTGKRYLVSNAIPTIFNMRLRKKYGTQLHTDHQELYKEKDDAIASTSEELYSGCITNINQNRDDLYKPCASIPKIQHSTLGVVHSESLDVSASNEEARKDPQQLHIEKCDVLDLNINYTESYADITNIDEEIQDKLQKSCTLPFKQQRLTKFGSLNSGIIEISFNDKETNNDAKELIRAKAYIKKLTRKLNASQQKYKRLHEKATSLGFLIRQLQDGKDATESLEELGVIK